MNSKPIERIVVLFCFTLSCWSYATCDSSGSPFGGGTGTGGNPYQICSTKHLLNMAGSSYTSASFILTTDLDVSGVPNLLPVGPTNPTFLFDGQNHTLSNWKGASPLFFYNSGTIQNLTIYNANITASCRGGLVGTNNSGGTVQNITITTMALSASCSTGALVGVNSGTLSTSSVSGLTLTSPSLLSDTLGGAVGWNLEGGTIHDVSVANSSLTTSGFNIGGFGGSNSGSITKCSTSNVNVQGYSNTGGFIGCGGDTDSIPPVGQFCQPPLHAGSPSVQKSSSAGGNINGVSNAQYSPTTPSSIGGFFGTNLADTTTDTYALNHVVGGTSSDSVGGFVGTGGCNSGPHCGAGTGATTTSFSGYAGSSGVSGTTNVGGFVGHPVVGTYSNDIYDTTNTGQSGAQPTGVTSNTNAAMTNPNGAVYVNFNFATIWNKPSGSGGYSTLQ